MSSSSADGGGSTPTTEAVTTTPSTTTAEGPTTPRPSTPPSVTTTTTTTATPKARISTTPILNTPRSIITTSVPTNIITTAVPTKAPQTTPQSITTAAIPTTPTPKIVQDWSLFGAGVGTGICICLVPVIIFLAYYFCYRKRLACFGHRTRSQSLVEQEFSAGITAVTNPYDIHDAFDMPSVYSKASSPGPEILEQGSVEEKQIKHLPSKYNKPHTLPRKTEEDGYSTPTPDMASKVRETLEKQPPASPTVKEMTPASPVMQQDGNSPALPMKTKRRTNEEQKEMADTEATFDTPPVRNSDGATFVRVSITGNDAPGGKKTDFEDLECTASGEENEYVSPSSRRADV